MKVSGNSLFVLLLYTVIASSVVSAKVCDGRRVTRSPIEKQFQSLLALTPALKVRLEDTVAEFQDRDGNIQVIEVAPHSPVPTRGDFDLAYVQQSTDTPVSRVVRAGHRVVPGGSLIVELGIVHTPKDGSLYPYIQALERADFGEVEAFISPRGRGQSYVVLFARKYR